MNAEPLADQLAKRRVAGPGAVREDPFPVGSKHGGCAVGELLDGEQRRIEALARECVPVHVLEDRTDRARRRARSERSFSGRG